MITLREHATVVLAAAFALAVPPGAATAAPVQAPACSLPAPSSTQPGYLVADPRCDLNGTPFTPLTDATGTPVSRVYTGVREGAGYRIEVPVAWNGQLVVYAHGFRGSGTTVSVDNPDLRAHYIAQGFAWAASSYATNGFDVGQGVRDTYPLIGVFGQVTGTAAGAVYMTGASMGGQVAAVAIEKYPTTFVGAMPYCGVLGDTALFDYFLDTDVTAAALAGVRIGFPLNPPADYADVWRRQVRMMMPALGVKLGNPPVPSTVGRTWSDVVERRSGGDRPGFDSAFAFWAAARSLEPQDELPFLFGVYPGTTGGTIDIADGNLTDNRMTVYRSTDGAQPTAAEQQLNATVLRVDRTAQADPGLAGVPRVDGDPTIPVLSLHDIGDLFVPLSMEQVYAQRAARNGKSALFVSRAIRGVNHCDFTPRELEQGFDDLVRWVSTGVPASGDDVLDPRAVADPAFGCRYTAGKHADFAPACPAG